MQLINLTVYKRNDILTLQDIAIDVDDIVGPIRFNSDSKSYFSMLVKHPASVPQLWITTSYQVDEDLADIKALSAKLVTLTVLRRDFASYDSEEMIFNVSHLVGPFVTVGIGTEFLYSELGANEPVKYIVAEDIASIMTQQAAGGGSGDITNLIEAGDNITLDGSGTLADPYIVGAAGFVQKTGTAITFDEEAFYGSIATPETGNFTVSFTGAKRGVDVLVFHNSGAEPTYPVTMQRTTGSQNYTPGVINYYLISYFGGTTAAYSIQQNI